MCEWGVYGVCVYVCMCVHSVCVYTVCVCTRYVCVHGCVCTWCVCVYMGCVCTRCVCVLYVWGIHLGGGLGGLVRRERRYRKPEGGFVKLSPNQPCNVQIFVFVLLILCCNLLVYMSRSPPDRESQELSLVCL